MAANNNTPAISLKLRIPGKSVLTAQGPGCTKQRKPKAAAKAPKQTKWSPENLAELIRVLTEQQAARNQADNAWKGCVWTAAELALCDSELILGGAPKDAKKCNSYWDKMCN